MCFKILVVEFVFGKCYTTEKSEVGLSMGELTRVPIGAPKASVRPR